MKLQPRFRYSAVRSRAFRDHRVDLGTQDRPNPGRLRGHKNAVRKLLEALRPESTGGALRTTSISPGFVRTELVDYVDDPYIRAQAQQRMATIGISPDAVARAVAFAIEQSDYPEIGEMTIRPAVQN